MSVSVSDHKKWKALLSSLSAGVFVSRDATLHIRSVLSVACAALVSDTVDDFGNGKINGYIIALNHAGSNEFSKQSMELLTNISNTTATAVELVLDIKETKLHTKTTINLQNEVSTIILYNRRFLHHILSVATQASSSRTWPRAHGNTSQATLDAHSRTPGRGRN